MKRGEAGCKTKAVLSAAECRTLLSGQYEFLKERPEPLCRELYINLSSGLFFPRSVVEYEREAYIWEPGSIRLTIDYNIRTSKVVEDFLRPSPPLVWADEGMRVLEIKYGNVIPLHISKLIQLDSREVGTMSKYALSRRFS